MLESLFSAHAACGCLPERELQVISADMPPFEGLFPKNEDSALFFTGGLKCH